MSFEQGEAEEEVVSLTEGGREGRKGGFGELIVGMEGGREEGREHDGTYNVSEAAEEEEAAACSSITTCSRSISSAFLPDTCHLNIDRYTLVSVLLFPSLPPSSLLHSMSISLPFV